KRAVRICRLKSRIDRRFRINPSKLDRTIALQCARLVPQRFDARRPVGIAEVEMSEVAAIIDNANDRPFAPPRAGRQIVGRSKDSGNGRVQHWPGLLRAFKADDPWIRADVGHAAERHSRGYYPVFAVPGLAQFGDWAKISSLLPDFRIVDDRQHCNVALP